MSPPGGVTDPLLAVEDLRVRFSLRAGGAQAVDGISWSLTAGETLAVVGESGSGKSVSALAVMGLLPGPPVCSVSGRVLLNGRDLLRCSGEELRRVRGREISMIFQDPLTSLNPVFTVGDQIAEVLRRRDGAGKATAWRAAVELLDDVGIPDPRHRAGEYPHQLAGGMQQRAMIAIALALNPKVLLADEPTSSVDVTVQAQVLELLSRVQGERGTSVVLITHDLSVVAGYADRVVVMYAGRVVETGRAVEVFHHPRHAYTSSLLASLPRLDRGRERLRPIPGQPPSAQSAPPGCPFHPRCGLATEICGTEVPLLAGQERPDHLAACHHSDRLGTRPEAAVLVEEQCGRATTLPAATDTADRLLEVDRLVKHYPVRTGRPIRRRLRRVRAVDGVSFVVAPGETLALVGESGSGKTTVARAVMGLIEPTSGRIRFDGDDLARVDRDQMRRLRRTMQIVFQDAYGSLDPRMTVKAILQEPFRIHGQPEEGRVGELLEVVGLSPAHAARYPHQLSSGQRQRVGIARAIALDPKLVVCDEAVSFLDVSLQAQILNLLADLQTTRSLAYLFIAHDLRVVRQVAHRVAVMYAGQIVETSDADHLFEHPAHPYTQSLLAAAPVPDPERSRRHVRPLTGDTDKRSPSDGVAGGCPFRTRCPKFASALTEVERRRCEDDAPALIERAGGSVAACHYAEERSVL